MGMTADPEREGITAVICTRDRPDLLLRALTSLMLLDPPASELLVVDNAPSDERAADVASEFPSVRYVREPVPGLDFARNRALAEARFPIVAFIDDDAVADPGWGEAFLSTFRERPEVAACTGRVEPLEVATESQRLFEANGGFSRGLDPIRLPGDFAQALHGRSAPAIAWAVSIGCGCSMAVRKDTVLAIGGFDNALDMGAVLPGGGDLDILWRLLDAGHGLQYQPKALAWHEHRRDMASIERQLVGHQRALLAFLSKSLRRARSGNRWQVASFLVWRMVKPVVRLWKRAIGRDPLPAALLARICWNCWIGAFFSYGAAVREAKRRTSARERVMP
jgi:GT2 family glycosyltransferase